MDGRRLSYDVHEHNMPPEAPSQPEQSPHQLLQRQLLALRAQEPGLGSLSDSRPLHDFRVALRRGRVLLRMLRSELPRDSYRRLNHELQWLAQVTSPSRDLDVQLEAIRAYAAQLDSAERHDLRPLLRAMQTERRAEHRQLLSLLHARRYAELIQLWQTTLDTTTATGAPQPTLHTARAQIRRHYRRVRRDARRLRHGPEADAMHDLRIAAKKLRYSLEFFRPLYPPRVIDVRVRELKALQDCLGDLHDLDQLLAALDRYREQLVEQSTATARTQSALERLQRTCRARLAGLQTQSLRQLHRLIQPRSRAAYRRLYRTPNHAQ